MRKMMWAFLLVLFVSPMLPQSKIYIPVEFQNAIKKGTRTTEGIPGENYWINSSDYKINAEVIVDSSLLRGAETIVYHNNSPDTLHKIVFRLYNDIFKYNAKRDYYWANLKTLPPVKIKKIKIGSQTFSDSSSNIRRGSTNLTVFLKKENHIMPNSKTEIEVEWELIIPEKSKLRMGNYDGENMFIAYWYPQIAVYDDVYGWDMIDYQGIVEFYNDPTNNYDVKIKLPKNVIMWATGTLQNAKEVLAPEIYPNYEMAKNSDEKIEIIGVIDLGEDNTADNSFNVWNFKAENVPDFSFAIGDGLLWDGKSIVIDSNTHRRVFVQTVYYFILTPYWLDALDIASESIEILSKELPGVPFPYPEMTSYCNLSKGGGMETPMMANDGAPLNLRNLINLIFHEISHTYFPFYMGTNERRFAWMDEGWATFFTGQIAEEYSDSTAATYWERITSAYQYNAGKENDVPPFVPSYSVKFGYPRITFYNRPALAYRELQYLLGEELFKQALQEYIKTWHGKHPLPIDFFFSFERTTGMDLSWFWRPWFYEFGYPDLAIDNVKFENNKVLVSVKKIGNIPVRVKLRAVYSDGKSELFEVNSNVWKNTNKAMFEISVKEKPVKILLGDKEIPDVDQSNNVFEIK